MEFYRQRREKKKDQIDDLSKYVLYQTSSKNLFSSKENVIRIQRKLYNATIYHGKKNENAKFEKKNNNNKYRCVTWKLKMWQK